MTSNISHAMFFITFCYIALKRPLAKVPLDSMTSNQRLAIAPTIFQTYDASRRSCEEFIPSLGLRLPVFSVLKLTAVCRACPTRNAMKLLLVLVLMPRS